MTRAWLCLFVLLAGLFVAGGVRAETCTATSASLNFGSISPVAGTAANATASVTITCTASVLAAGVRVCMGFGPGTAQTSYAPRFATSGVSTLQYNLYTTSAAGTIWGNRASTTYTPVSIDVPSLLGSGGSTTVTVYGRVAASQTTLPAGTYTASFSGAAQAVLIYKEYPLLTNAPDCSTLTTPSSSFAFDVSATVINDCTIAATNIDFGTRGVLTSTITATGTLSVTCTNADAYSISLSAGTSANATIVDRRMTRAGGTDQIHYGLYTTSAFSTPWGDGTGGSSTLGGTGTGNSQAITVYARVLPQTTPQPGSYIDTVIATITY